MNAGAGTLISEATWVSMSELKLIMPRLIITGPSSTPTRRTAGMPQVQTPGRPRPSAGTTAYSATAPSTR